MTTTVQHTACRRPHGSRAPAWAALRMVVCTGRLGWLVLALVCAMGPVEGAPASALIEAVKRADAAGVRAAIERRSADVRLTEADGTTALHWAVRAGDAHITNLLIDAGADVNAANRYGATPLWLAAVNGDASLMERLLVAGADPHSVTSEGETLLMTAARSGTLAGVEMLMARGANVNAKETWRGQTALMWAAAEGHADVTRALIARDADIHARSTGGFTPLLFAVREGRIETTRTLLDAGASVHEALEKSGTTRTVGGVEVATKETGLNALLLATGNGHFELAAMLLDRGADPNAAPQGWTALHQLTWVRKTGVAGSNNPPPIGSGTMTSLELARRLVAKGANVNGRASKRPPVGVSGLNMVGATPFLLAARTADAEYMRLLASLGADPLMPNVDESSPLLVAAGLGTYAPGEDPGTESEVLEAVKLTLELGNDVNHVDKRGNTAMHGAAYKHVPSVVRFLAESGAKVEVWNHGNANAHTPLSITQGVQSSMSIIRSAVTEAAIREVMRSAGVEPSPR